MPLLIVDVARPNRLDHGLLTGPPLRGNRVHLSVPPGLTLEVTVRAPAVRYRPGTVTGAA